MNWLRKLPNSRRSASGLEWKLWRRLPVVLAVGTLLPLLAAQLLHWLADPGNAAGLRWLQTMDYVVIGVLVCHWTAVGTLAIGCVVVMLMKGPGYVADGLEVSHSDAPRAVAESGTEPL